MTQPDSAARDQGWDVLVGHLAEVADVAPDAIGRETRLVDDLNLDSLGLTETAVVLLADLGLEELPEPLAAADWSKLTVGELYDQCRGGSREGKARFAFE